MVCNSPSISSNAAYFARTGDMHSSDAHLCQLEKGHAGPHAKRALSRLGPNLGMEITYVWEDEHTLVAHPRVVTMEPDPMTVIRTGTN